MLTATHAVMQKNLQNPKIKSSMYD